MEIEIIEGWYNGSPVTSIGHALAIHDETTPHDGEWETTVAGRIVELRGFLGKLILIFATIKNSGQTMEIGLTTKFLESSNLEICKSIKVGDIVWVKGKVGHTKKRVITMWANELTIIGETSNG